MGFAERDAALDPLRSAGHDEQRVAILLDLRVLVRLAGILDGKIMQAELRLHPRQQLGAGLKQTDPDDMAWPLRPPAGLVDRNLFDPATVGIDARIDEPGLATRWRGQRLRRVDLGVQGICCVVRSCRSGLHQRLNQPTGPVNVPLPGPFIPPLAAHRENNWPKAVPRSHVTRYHGTDKPGSMAEY
jgi:hypothetical protein